MIRKYFKPLFISIISLILKVFFNRKPKYTKKRILLIHQFFIGDLLFFTPTITEIKKKYIDYELDIWVNSISEPIVRYNPYISKVYSNKQSVVKQSSIKVVLSEIYSNWNTLKNLNSKKYEIIINVTESLPSIIFTSLIGTKTRIGLLNCMSYSRIYDQFITSNISDVHLKYMYAKILLLLKIPYNKNDFKFILELGDDINNNINILKIKKNYKHIITIAPFAGWKSKELSLKKIDNIVNKILKKNKNVRIIFVGGINDIKRIKVLNRFFGNRVINLVGQLTLLETASIINSSTMFLGMDSGLSHIAEGMNTNSIIVFGSTNPKNVYDDNCHTVIPFYNKHLRCLPKLGEKYCNNNMYYDCKNIECLESIDEVQLVKIILDNIPN